MGNTTLKQGSIKASNKNNYSNTIPKTITYEIEEGNNAIDGLSAWYPQE